MIQGDAIWRFIIDLSDLIASGANILAAAIAGGALVWSLRTYRESKSLSHYGELDRMYADLLKLAVEEPHLRQGPDTERDPNEEKQWPIYAYMVWNFLETVHDRVYYKHDRVYYESADIRLQETWGKVIRLEHEIFGLWFKDNAEVFKGTFVEFIEEQIDIWKQDPNWRQPEPGKRRQG